MSRRLVRSQSAPPRQRGRSQRAGHRALAVATAVCALVAVLAAAAPAAARQDVPVQLTVTVVPPSGAPGPRPAGGVIVSVDGRRLLSLPLVRGIASLTSITPQIAAVLELLGHRVTIRYSGDSNYEASTGISVTLPTRGLLTIVARPRDSAPPAIEIRSPVDGARYARGEAVAASYSCRDPDDRSAVTACDGPVGSGAALDTTSAGTFAFAVRGEDALGNAASRTVTYEVGGSGPGGPGGSEPGGPGEPEPGGPDGAGPDTTGSSDDGSPAGPEPAGPGDAGAEPMAPAGVPPAALVPAGLPPAVAGPVGAGPQPSGAPTGSSSAPLAPSGSRAPVPPLAGASSGAAEQVLASYDPRADPAKTLGLLVAAFTLLQLGAGTGGLALARGGGVVRTAARRQLAGDGPPERRRAAASGSRPDPEFGYERLRVKFLGAGLGAVAIGDRSRTWSWPGTQRIDALGATLPARLARRSPLLARVAADGTYLRAILGSASLLGMLAGLALGVAAVRDTGGDALPPAAALTIAIAMLGVLDAAAGLVAVLTFTIGVLALGGVDSGADLRLMLSLAVLWFVVPVLAGSVRPLRRPPARSFGESWDRGADFVIASLVGAWTVHQIVEALPGIAGRQLAIAAHAETAAFCVLAALVVRLAAETIAAHLYPRRLDISEPAGLPQPGVLQHLAAGALRTTLFVFFGYIVAGSGWQLWVAAALFLFPQVLAAYRERLPNSPALFRARPRGLVRIVLMLFVASALAWLLLRTMDERSDTFLADSFVVLALPGVVLGLLPVFGRTGDRAPIGWGKRIAGVAILAAGILLALGVLL